MSKTYKDLTAEEETELMLWLSFFKDSVNNAHIQMKRWQQTDNFWDLRMYFLAVILIDDAASSLKRFPTYDSEVWDILKKFRKNIEKHNLRDLRNQIVHPKQLFKGKERREIHFPKVQ